LLESGILLAAIAAVVLNAFYNGSATAASARMQATPARRSPSTPDTASRHKRLGRLAPRLARRPWRAIFVCHGTASASQRVDPFGNLFADSSRGLFFGNRAGAFNRDDRTLGLRRGRRAPGSAAASNSRPATATSGKSYTELFFLDEPTGSPRSSPLFRVPPRRCQGVCAAFAAGHGLSAVPRAPEMAACCMQAARRPRQAQAPLAIDDLPRRRLFAFADEPGTIFAMRGAWLLPGAPPDMARPGHGHRLVVDVLTRGDPCGAARRISAVMASDGERDIARIGRRCLGKTDELAR